MLRQPLKNSSTFALTILLALLNYAAGKLALLIAVPPGYATAFWPPAGFALAAVLLYGNRVGFGIFLGSFLLNVRTGFDASHPQALFISLALPSAIGLLSSLQAVVAAFVVKKFAGYPEKFEKGDHITRFLFLGGPLACLTASGFGIALLLWAGKIAPEKFLSSAATWWAGDTLGVLIFTPVMLTWLWPSGLGDKSKSVLGQKAAPLAAFLLSMVFTWWYSGISIKNVQAKGALRFDASINEMTTAISRRMNIYQQMLYGARGLFAASDGVERDEWRRYVNHLQLEENYPGIQGVGFSLALQPSEKAAHIQHVRSQGFSDYRVWPEGPRSVYSSIIYLEPFSRRNLRAFGYDMYSDEVRREAMSRARDSGWPSLSGKVTLVQETSSQIQNGFILFVPIYKNGETPATLEQRRENFRGWVYSPFRVNDLMEGILKSYDPIAHLDIFDGEIPSPEHALFDSNSIFEPMSHVHPSLFEDSRNINVAGRSWVLEYKSHPVFDKSLDYGESRRVIMFGICLSFLISGLTWMVFSTRVRAQTLAESITQELRADMAMRKIAEQELLKAHVLIQEKEAFLRSVLIHMPVALFMKDVQDDFRFIIWNDACEQMFGIRREEILGKTDYDFFPKEQADFFRKKDEEVMRQNVVVDIPEETISSKSHGVILLHTLKVPLSDGQGRPRYLLGISENITERKKVERMKNEFISTVSHELRTPLTSIRGSLGIIMQGATGTLADQTKDILSIAYRNCERLVRLINDILDIEKIESGKMQFRYEPHDLAALVQSSIESNRAYAGQYQIQLHSVDQCPGAQVHVDADRFAQISTNLISNACKFSPAGSRVEIRTERRASRVRVSVKDQGPGIPEEFKNRIFMKFSQADASGDPRRGGTGLGLSITKALVESMGGTIGFDSEPGKGTTFYVELLECCAVPARKKPS